MSEEAQKIRYQDFHRFKEKHICKITKLNTNFDLSIMLLIKSNNKQFLTKNIEKKLSSSNREIKYLLEKNID